MKHLDETGGVENTFRTRPVFSEQPPWSLDDEPAHRSADHKGLVFDPEAPDAEQPQQQEDDGWY